MTPLATLRRPTTRSDTSPYYMSLICALRVTNPSHEHTVHVFIVPWRYVYLQIGDPLYNICFEEAKIFRPLLLRQTAPSGRPQRSWVILPRRLKNSEETLQVVIATNNDASRRHCI